MTSADALQPIRPLCVDLDGTLIKSDLLIESAIALAKQNVLSLLRFPWWLRKGKAHFKHQIAQRIDLRPDQLPYNERLLIYLREEARCNRPIALATASNEKLARQVADYLGIFNAVYASTPHENLSGQAKLKQLVDAYGEKGFDYVANDHVDLPIFQHANAAILVNPISGLETAAGQTSNVILTLDDRPPQFRQYAKAIRVHQWLKNLLVFVPLVLGHHFDFTSVFFAFIAFLCFSFTASSVYLLNDLLDLSSDRSHPRKRNRPFAAGTINIKVGTALIPMFLAVAVILGLFLPADFLAVLATYFALTLLYSFFIKHKVIIDVILLAGLYTIRVVAGTVAISAVLSFWLLVFSIFIFLSLALIKRSAELQTHLNSDSDVPTRGYVKSDIEYLHSMGTAAGYVAALVIAFYINSDATAPLYSRPMLLWLVCPLLLYWISRLWIATGRGQMHDDPLVFAIRDRTSLVTIAAIFGVVMFAI